MDAEKTFEKLRRHQLETARLQATQALLEWDERTGMPPAAGDFRAEQIAQMAGMIHRRNTAKELGEWLSELTEAFQGEDPSGDQAASMAVMRREYDRATRLEQRLVEAISAATTRGQQSWDAARKKDDFAAFAPALAKVIELKREAAAALAIGDQTPYEALMEDYEPGMDERELERTFASLRPRLVQLLERADASDRKPDDSVLRRHVPVDRQRELSRLAAETIGFDFAAGRLDTTSHPFCTELGPGDVRILTRYQEDWLPAGLFGTLHEAGHGLYEQNLRRDWYGMPPGRYASLSVHESQSRLWENVVGRSLPFCRHLWPHAQQMFTPELDGVSAEQFWRAVNRVGRSLIRVEADEVTYNLHVLIRFDLERQLLSSELPVAELPAAWNDRYESDLGVRPPSDADGALQDVHWSAGLIGYFPTYTLGNIIAAQLMAAAQRDLGDQDEAWARGEFAPLLDWLREHVYRWGRTLTPLEIVRRVTGGPLDGNPLLEYLEAKFERVYR